MEMNRRNFLVEFNLQIKRKPLLRIAVKAIITGVEGYLVKIK